VAAGEGSSASAPEPEAQQQRRCMPPPRMALNSVELDDDGVPVQGGDDGRSGRIIHVRDLSLKCWLFAVGQINVMR
jgi:hypothetical protein